MTLDSSSTIAQVIASYDDNASYEEDGSVAKARAFLTACRILQRRLPRQQGVGNKVVLTPEQLREEIKDVRTWLAGHDPTGGGTVGGGAGSASVSYGPGGPTVTQLTMDGGR